MGSFPTNTHGAKWPVLFIAVPAWRRAQAIEAAKAEGIAVSKWCRRVLEAALDAQYPDTATVAPAPPPEQALTGVWKAVYTFIKNAGGSMPYRELKPRLEDLEYKGVDTALLKGDVPAPIVRGQRDDGVWFALAPGVS